MATVIKRTIITFASIGMFVAPLASADTHSGNPRQMFTSVGKKVVVKLPVERECWLIGGNSDSMFGLSANHSWQYGIIFTDQGPNPVLEVETLVGLRGGFAEDLTAKWNMLFQARGTTNGKDFAYLSEITRPQAKQILGSALITFTAFYETERGAGHISLAHQVDFSQAALDALGRCVRSLQ